jgi:hypothetical protein
MTHQRKIEDENRREDGDPAITWARPLSHCQNGEKIGREIVKILKQKWPVFLAKNCFFKVPPKVFPKCTTAGCPWHSHRGRCPTWRGC